MSVFCGKYIHTFFMNVYTEILKILKILKWEVCERHLWKIYPSLFFQTIFSTQLFNFETLVIDVLTGGGRTKAADIESKRPMYRSKRPMLGHSGRCFCTKAADGQSSRCYYFLNVKRPMLGQSGR